MKCYISKSEELNRIIEQLYQIYSETDYENICKQLEDVYLDAEGNVNEQFRHEYSSISGKIRELNEIEIDGQKVYLLEYLLENINGLYDYAYKQGKPYINNLFKLKDHIGLEIGRILLVEQLRWEINNGQESVKGQLQYMQYVTSLISEQTQQSTDLLNHLKEAEKENEDNIKKSHESLVQLSGIAEEAADKVENVQKDSIAILGIFASIVLSFTAGVVFTSSVLENIDKASPYRLAGVVILIGVVLTNVITILMMYIDKIRSLKSTKIEFPKTVKWINAIYSVAFIGDLILWIIFTKPYI